MLKQGSSAVATTRSWVNSKAAWCRCTLSGNGSVLAFCETVLWRSAFATRCWVTSEAAWDSRAFNGDGQCWLSPRLLCRCSSRLNKAARGWLQTFLGSAERSQCWLSVRLFCGGQHWRHELGYFRGYMTQPRFLWLWSVLAFSEAVVSGQWPSQHGGARLASGVTRFGQASPPRCWVTVEAI